MSTNTRGRIKGFVRYEEILSFIKQKWDKNAINNISKEINCPISKCNWEYKINEHSEDNMNWYTICGSIRFKCNDKDRRLFYSYNNLNDLEDLDYYEKCNLRDMIESETTYISLDYYNDSVEIIKEIIAHFGGGWLDEDDCDDEEYYLVKEKKDENIQPVKYITMDEIRKMFGYDNIVIADY